MTWLEAFFYWTGVCVWACYAGFFLAYWGAKAWRVYQARRRIHQQVQAMMDCGRWPAWSGK